MRRKLVWGETRIALDSARKRAWPRQGAVGGGAEWQDLVVSEAAMAPYLHVADLSCSAIFWQAQSRRHDLKFYAYPKKTFRRSIPSRELPDFFPGHLYLKASLPDSYFLWQDSSLGVRTPWQVLPLYWAAISSSSTQLVWTHAPVHRTDFEQHTERFPFRRKSQNQFSFKKSHLQRLFSREKLEGTKSSQGTRPAADLHMAAWDVCSWTEACRSSESSFCGEYITKINNYLQEGKSSCFNWYLRTWSSDAFSLYSCINH